jgi:hypothetical protein
VFDPEETSYKKLLEFFFQIHDPTTLNRQGNDIGTSYRSAIFYLDDEQRRIAEETIADVEASGRWPGKVVTEVAPAGPFWEAEPEHQDYLENYPNGYTCHFVRPDWVLPERTKGRGWLAKPTARCPHRSTVTTFNALSGKKMPSSLRSSRRTNSRTSTFPARSTFR